MLTVCYAPSIPVENRAWTVPTALSLASGEGPQPVLLISLLFSAQISILICNLHWSSYGANKLPDLDFKPLWRLIYEALQDKTLIMLIVAAGISMAVSMSTEGPAKGWKDGTAVLIAVAVVVTITRSDKTRARNGATDGL